jgi:acetyl esterase
MPLDPDIAGLLTLIEAGTPMSEQSPEQARTAFRTLTVDLRPPEAIVQVGSTEDIEVPGAEGPLPARVYRPEGNVHGRTIALFHGGGYVIGDIETHDNMARAICRGTNAVVVSVGYRLAPEHRFPAGVLDAVAATQWIGEHLETFGGVGVLAIAGDSAGGNFSAVVSQLVPGIAAQFLIYPATHPLGDYPSRHENANGYFLDEPTMQWFFTQYVDEGVDPSDPRLSPLLAESLEGLPPAVVITAEFDPLRDEGEAYAAALEKAGVPVVARRYDGMIHGFMDMGPFSPAAKAALDDAIALFADVLDGLTSTPTTSSS